jgi:hypothetical protein
VIGGDEQFATAALDCVWDIPRASTNSSKYVIGRILGERAIATQLGFSVLPFSFIAPKDVASTETYEGTDGI